MRVLTVLASLVVLIFAQVSEVRGQAVRPVPGAKTSLIGRNGPLSLQEVDVHIEIDGLIARTTLTLTVHNNATVRNEGTLLFEVPPGATVSAYALNVSGTIVDGVAVERERARQSYSAEVARRVDPGLVLEPTGEETGFTSTTTPIGGLLFTDCHDGYGPQEYCLRQKVPGRYVMRVRVASTVLARTPTTVQATIVTDFGRATEKRRLVSMMLNNGADTVELGSLTISRDGGKQ